MRFVSFQFIFLSTSTTAERTSACTHTLFIQHISTSKNHIARNQPQIMTVFMCEWNFLNFSSFSDIYILKLIHLHPSPAISSTRYICCCFFSISSHHQILDSLSLCSFQTHYFHFVRLLFVDFLVFKFFSLFFILLRISPHFANAIFTDRSTK